ncbi:MAG TPA: phospholipase [Micromonosporaceae bacterium]|jgi:hypothetical protein
MHTHHHTADASESASVVLDIGADVGALILYVPAACHGREIEISRGTEPRTHAAVRERIVEDGSIYCVVYGSLPEGEYTVWDDETTAGGTVTVTGGEIAELDWVARLS